MVPLLLILNTSERNQHILERDGDRFPLQGRRACGSGGHCQGPPRGSLLLGLQALRGHASEEVRELSVRHCVRQGR